MSYAFDFNQVRYYNIMDYSMVSTVSSVLPGPNRPAGHKGILELPTEVLKLVFEELDDYRYAMGLAISSGRLLHICESKIHSLNDWGGQVPSGMFTEAEEHEYRMYRLTRVYDDGGKVNSHILDHLNPHGGEWYYTGDIDPNLRSNEEDGAEPGSEERLKLWAYNNLERLLRITKPKRPIGHNGLFGLPTELLKAIFEELDDYEDAICLGICNTLLLHIGEAQIRHLITCYVREISWSGDRIVWNGCDSDQVPPGMFTEAEEREYRTFKLTKVYDDGGDVNWHVPEHLNPHDGVYCDADVDMDLRLSEEDGAEPGIEERLSLFAEDRFDNYGLHHPRPNFYCCVRGTTRCRNQTDLALIDDITSELNKRRYIKELPVMCNLTKNEYFRASVVLRRLRRKKMKKSIGFMEVVLITICWSPGSRQANGSPVWGMWAGDRLQLTNEEEIKSVTDGNSRWEDVSGKVAAGVTKLRGLLPWEY
ncbi:hypothetical protein GLOTRDRAFT_131547 [Gloeophyllum trabeum ATCC 11539]|uniref:Uncharacterized protein n=1 Tax=Gloeophyllum trabeum (strain ATCC 11539 / FP-39264 / Madison 617) TaxID=670483 RepID=S7Q021_GLOTA|nr:uncharacterized protein GLOTRDRAFT_131547 [Gloeophyllum trabeum ATCC 11539]EPQ53276.1 hypothetical protein GLOTRDRAFT_131547 [Gloeophyllum trabeum ATCC 11539]